MHIYHLIHFSRELDRRYVLKLGKFSWARGRLNRLAYRLVALGGIAIAQASIDTGQFPGLFSSQSAQAAISVALDPNEAVFLSNKSWNLWADLGKPRSHLYLDGHKFWRDYRTITSRKTISVPDRLDYSVDLLIQRFGSNSRYGSSSSSGSSSSGGTTSSGSTATFKPEYTRFLFNRTFNLWADLGKPSGHVYFQAHEFWKKHKSIATAKAIAVPSAFNFSFDLIAKRFGVKLAQGGSSSNTGSANPPVQDDTTASSGSGASGNMQSVKNLSPGKSLGSRKITANKTVIQGYTITGYLNIRANNVIVRGNKFRPGSRIEINGENVLITGNKFEVDPKATDIDIEISRGRNAKIVGNYFTTIVNGVRKYGSTSQTNDLGIYVGTFSARYGRDQMLKFGDHNVLIEDNLFEEYYRRWSLVIKSIGNVIRDNTVNNSLSKIAGSMASRHGSDNLIQNNSLKNTQGMHVFEDNNTLIGNKLTGGRFLVLAGAGPVTQFGTRQQHRACNTLMRRNSGPLIVGYQWVTKNVDPACNTVVENHSGSITKRYQKNTKIR